MAIDMLVVRADLRSQSIQIRWVDTRQMIVDSLTKVGASADFLFFVLRFGRYVCVCERNGIVRMESSREETESHQRF